MNAAAKVFTDKQYPRQPQEKYYTPVWVTEALLRRVGFHEVVWEPAAGDGNIARPLVEAGASVYASDIAPEQLSILALDFLSSKAYAGVPGAFDIITNPPFGHGGALAVKFIQRALTLTKPHGGKVAMLLRDDFDSAPGRKHLFRNHPAWGTKLVLLERIRWTNMPQKAAGPSGAHAWYIWDWLLADDGFVPTLLYEGRL